MFNFIQKNSLIFLGLLIFFGLMFNIVNNHNQRKLLEKSITTFAIFVSECHEGKNPDGTFEFKIKKTKYKFDQIGDFSFLKKGDTVLIKYAIEDPNVAVVEDRFYMKKYKHLKN